MIYLLPICLWLWRWIAVATLPLFFPAAASALNAAPDWFRELESKYIFGVTADSVIVKEGEIEHKNETNAAFQKRTGAYGALEHETELKYNPFDSFRIEAAAHGADIWISGVNGLEDRHGANFGGLSAVFRYLVIGRGSGAPVGLQVAVEPEWPRVDDAGKATGGRRKYPRSYRFYAE